MKSKTHENGYIIRLEKGEEIVESISRFMSEKEIPGGVLTGLGAADMIRVGYFDPASGSYPEKTFTGNLEILMLAGNLSWTDREPKPHLHITFSDEQMIARGGHLIEGNISVTCEIHVRVFSSRTQRKLDPETGLPLLDL